MADDEEESDEAPPESYPDGNRESLPFILGLLGGGVVLGALVMYFVLRVAGFLRF